MKYIFLIFLINGFVTIETYAKDLLGRSVPFWDKEPKSKTRPYGRFSYKAVIRKLSQSTKNYIKIKIIDPGPHANSLTTRNKTGWVRKKDLTKSLKMGLKLQPKTSKRSRSEPPLRMEDDKSMPTIPDSENDLDKIVSIEGELLTKTTVMYSTPRAESNNIRGYFIKGLKYKEVPPKVDCCIKLEVVKAPEKAIPNTYSVPGPEGWGWVKFDSLLETAAKHAVSAKSKVTKITSPKTGCKTRPKVRQSLPEEPEETENEDQGEESTPITEPTPSCNALRTFRGRRYTDGQREVLLKCFMDLKKKVTQGLGEGDYEKIFKNIYLLPADERDFFISLVTALGEAGNMGDYPPVEMMNVMLTLRNRVFHQKVGKHIIWIKQKKKMIKSLSRNPLKAKLYLGSPSELKRAKQLIRELKKAGFHFRDLEEFVRNDGVKKLEKAFRGNIKYTLKPFYKYGLKKVRDLKKLLKLLTKLTITTDHNEKIREKKEKIRIYQSTQKSDNKTTIFDVAMQYGQYDANKETNSQWKGVLFNNWKGKFKIKKGEVIKAIDAFSRLNEVEKGITSTDSRRYVTHYYSPYYVGTPKFLKSRKSGGKLVSDRSRIRESVVDMRYDGYPNSAHDSSKGEFNCSLPKEDRRQPEDISSGHCFYRVDQIGLGSPRHDWVKYKSLRKD